MKTMRSSRILFWMVLTCLFCGFIHAQDNPERRPKPEADEQNDHGAGLAASYYGGKQFVYWGGSFTQEGLDFRYDLNKMKWPPIQHDKQLGRALFDRPRGEWSMVLRGMLAIPQAGAYTFRSTGTNGRLRIHGSWLTVGSDQTLELPQTSVPIEIYLSQGEGNQPITLNLLWKTPATESFEPVAPSSLRHEKADEPGMTPLRPDIPLTKADHQLEDYLAYDVMIETSGYYRFSLRGGGEFRWGIINPPHATATLDGTPLLHYYNACSGRTLGFFDDLQSVRYLKKGKHLLEIQAEKVQRYMPIEQIPTLRLWLDHLDSKVNAGQTLTINQTPAGETVFRKGEALTLQLQQSTLGQSARQYTLKVFPQRHANDAKPVSQLTTQLPAESEQAQAELRYLCDTEGAFEAVIVDDTGNTVEGPWEFAVIDPTPLAVPKAGQPYTEPKGVLVDSIDCSEDKGGEHLFRDNGTSRLLRSPDGTPYRVTGGHYEYVVYEDVDNKHQEFKKYAHKNAPKKPSGYTVGMSDQDWFAYTLKVKHPGMAHMVVVRIPADRYRRVPVQAIDHITGLYNGALMEVLPDTERPWVELRFPFWPNGNAFDITTAAGQGYHDTLKTESAAARIELYEYPDGFPVLPQAACGWNNARQFGSAGEQANLSPEVRTTPKLWEDGHIVGATLTRNEYGWGFYHDYAAYLQSWSRFGEYSQWRGDNFLCWPIHAYGMAHVRTRRLSWGVDIFTEGFNYRPIDMFPRNTLKIILLLCEKYGIDFVGDMQINSRTNEELMTQHIAQTENVPLEKMSGLFLEGGPQFPMRVLNPAHPVARSFLINFYGDIAKDYGAYPAFKGINIRSWSSWTNAVAASFIAPDVGYGDYTIKLFSKETGIDVPSADDMKNKYKIRYDFLVRNPKYRKQWFDWREQKVTSLRQEILSEMRKYAPQMRLYSSSSTLMPKTELGHGLNAHTPQATDLGYCRQINHGVPGAEINKLDMNTYANFDIRPNIQKPTMNDWMRSRYTYPEGLCTGGGISTSPLKELAKELAKEPIERVVHTCPWALPPTTDSLRAWVQAWRAIPSLQYERLSEQNGSDDNVVCWQAQDPQRGSVFYLVNNSAVQQKVTLRFARPVKSLQNLVTGEMLTGQEVTLPDYGLLLFAAKEAAVQSLAAVPLDSPWLENDAHSRLHFEIRNPGALARDNELVIISGKEILKALQMKKPERSDLQVWVQGVRLPSQVDTRDAVGRYRPREDMLLSENDELCFQVNFCEGQSTADVWIYIGGADSPTAVPFTTQPAEKLTRKTPYTLLVDNGLIQAGFTRYGPLKEGQTTCAGGLSYLTINGVTVLNQMKNNGHVVPVMPIRDWPGMITEPQVVSSGPVRVLVELELPQPCEIDWLFTSGNRHFQDGFLRGATSRQVLQLCAQSPVVEQRQIYTYEQTYLPNFNTTPDWFDMHSFGQKDEDKHLYYSFMNEPKEEAWLGKDKGFAKSSEMTENWFALWDSELHKGVGLIAEHPLYSIIYANRILARYSNKAIPEHGLTIRHCIVALDQEGKENAARWNKRLSQMPMVIFRSITSKQ